MLVVEDMLGVELAEGDCDIDDVVVIEGVAPALRVTETDVVEVALCVSLLLAVDV